MNDNLFGWISKLFKFANFKVGGTMSEEGANAAGKDVSFGIKFCLCCIGSGIMLFLVMAGLHFIKWW